MFCFQETGAEISILVINTDPSDTVRIRCRQVVLEGFYQLFINSTLNSSCGQLKEIEEAHNFLRQSIVCKYV